MKIKNWLFKSASIAVLMLFINNSAIAECYWSPSLVTYSEAERRCSNIGGYIPTVNEMNSKIKLGKCSKLQKDTWLYGGWVGNYHSNSRDNKYKERRDYYNSSRTAASICVK